MELDCHVENVQIENVHLRVLNLISVERTIDQIFEVLEDQNRPELLEELCPYFGAIWPSGLALAQFVLRQPSLEEGLLELGCGLSLPGLVLAKKGHRLVVSDFHPDVPEFLRRNVQLNEIPEGLIEFRGQDWKQLQPRPGEFATLLASDVLYDRHQALELVACIERFRSSGLRRFILADPGRPFLQTFQNEWISRFGRPLTTVIEKCQSLHKGQEVWILDGKI